ncbi:MAG: hypothetical protein KF775_06170 [Cyclobacteriaceae bacterium]|nr:hypothetical protein [Cyclobacteriaceae bacterium]
MNCTEAKNYLNKLSELTPEQERMVAEHGAGCAHCREDFELIRLQQRFVKVAKANSAEPVHAAALTQKIMQALPQRIQTERAIFIPLRIAFGVSVFLILFFLGWEFMRTPEITKAAVTNGPQLHSSIYITNPLQREAKPLGLVARIKTQSYELN